MKKSLFAVLAVGLGLTANVMAQVPNYVPANGLVGWWPFNGNANDESGNGNNGTVNGATLTADRFGSSNSAYHLDGDGDNIFVSNNFFNNGSSWSLSIWYKLDQLANPFNGASSHILFNTSPHNGLGLAMNWGNTSKYSMSIGNGTPSTSWNVIFNAQSNQNILLNSWHHVALVKSGNIYSLYIDGILDSSWNASTAISTYFYQMYFGACVPINSNEVIIGSIDDIGSWNRALSQQEILDLYSAINCTNDLTVSPIVNTIQTGSTANFTATTSNANSTFIWQSDFGQGFQTLNNVGNYSGTNTNNLSISNIQLANHNQPIRALSSNANCTDTSNIATIQIADTCIMNVTDTSYVTVTDTNVVTVYDTLLTAVTDTLVINTTLSLPAPNNENTILVYPNPANDHITIDYGNYAIMNGYQLRIENSLGQQVFQTAINLQSNYLDLSTWGGNGIYYVHIIDPQSNTIDIRKIVLQ